MGALRRAAAAFAALLLAGCSSREALVVYSPHGPDILADYEKRFEAAHPGVDVQWFDLGSKQCYERIRAESGRPLCDVWWGGPATMFMQAADEGLLAPYTPTWADAGGKDAKDRWYGTYSSPLVIVFNTDGNTRDSVPHAWDELLVPAWKGKITLRTPLESGTLRTFIGATFLREGGDEPGVAWLRRFHESVEAYMPNPQQLFDHLKRNPELISVWILPDIPLQRDRNGYPFGWVVPKETPVLDEGIAIVANAPHRELAEAFYEFVTSEESLAHQAKDYWKVPLRNDLDPASLPGWIGEQAIEAQPIDWVEFAANEERWMGLWREEVYGRR